MKCCGDANHQYDERLLLIAFLTSGSTHFIQVPTRTPNTGGIPGQHPLLHCVLPESSVRQPHHILGGKVTWPHSLGHAAGEARQPGQETRKALEAPLGPSARSLRPGHKVPSPDKRTPPPAPPQAPCGLGATCSSRPELRLSILRREARTPSLPAPDKPDQVGHAGAHHHHHHGRLLLLLLRPLPPRFPRRRHRANQAPANREAALYPLPETPVARDAGSDPP